MTKVTTTTTAQSIEAVSSRAKADLAKAVMTPVQAAIQAVELHRREVMNPAYRAFEKAEQERWAAERALKAVPFPAELLVVPKMTDEPLTWITALVHRHPDGRETRVEIERDRSLRLETREALAAYFGEDHPDFANLSDLLAGWQTETAALRHAAEAIEAKAERLDRAWQRSYDMNDRLCRAILRAPAELSEAAVQAEAYARLLAGGERQKWKPADVADTEDAKPMIEFMHRALKRSGDDQPRDPVAEERAEWVAGNAVVGREAINAAWEASGVRAKWDAAVTAVDKAEASYQQANRALDEYERAHPGEGDSDPGYAAVDDVVNQAQSLQFETLRALLEVQAPDAAALARQVQTYAWLTNVTNHEIKGLTGWPLDPAEQPVAAAIDNDGDIDERSMLALYRSAHALAGRPPMKSISPERLEGTEQPALLAAE
jgi:hypothetical protein